VKMRVGGWVWHGSGWLAVSLAVLACGWDVADATKDLGEEDLLGEPLRISMDFKDANLKDVLKTFSQQTGVNVIASENIGEKAITLYLEDVTVMDALDQILQAAGLTYERSPGSQIYIVKPKPELPGGTQVETITRVYRLKFARVSTSRLARAAEALGAQTPFEAAKTTAALSSQGGSTGSGSSGSTSGSSGASGSSQGKEIGIDKVVEKLLTDVGKVVVDERTNSLIVTDVASNFPRIESVLSTLDVRTAQVLIESEVLETTLGKVKSLGIEWGSGSEGNQVTFTPGSRTTRFPFGFFGTGIAPSLPTPFSLSTLSAASAVGTLQALQRDSDTKILARPKVLTLDNESAMIRLTTNQAVGFTTTTGQQTNTTSVTPERVTTGVILVVTPQVNQDGYITMLVEPSVTKVATASVTPPSTAGTIVDPKTRSARSMVRVRNGDTLVLGGLIDRSEDQTERKVPFLGDLPIVGRIFRDLEVNNAASELIVFITPRVLEEPGEGQLAAVGLLSPPGEREQEPVAGRGEAIEQRLDILEHEQEGR